MASIGKSIGYNFFAQLFGRIISFIINVYLLRVIDSEVIGIVNVRLTLLYNTILFLTREPLRKGKIFEGTLPQFVNIVWLSPVIATVLSVICVAFWSIFSSTSKEIPTFVLLAFPLSAIIESIGEPFAVFSLRFSLTAHYAWSQCLLISFQRIFVLFLLFTNSYSHLMIYALAQIFASISYTLFHFWCFFKFSKQKIPELNSFPSFKSFFPSFNLGVNTNALANLAYLFGHSFLKQLATDSSGYLMTFTEITSLKNQAVFDAIEKLGSLVCRIVLAPLEESCAAHFRNEIHNASKTLRKSFIDILHVSSVIGLIVCTFGIPYSKIAVWLYGGKLLVENGGDLLLSVYCIYIFVMAVNGITECFAMATMGNAQLLKHSYFLFFLALLQPFLAYHLVSIVGVSGFIVSKCIDMILRIIFSWLQSRKFFGNELMITDILPSWSILLLILLTFTGTFFSSQYFEATEFMQSLCHLIIGGILFVLLSLYVVFYDPVFNIFVSSKVKSK